MNDRSIKPVVRKGDRIRFDTQSNIGIREDTVREVFWQDTGYEAGWAVVLTNHSWTWVRSIVCHVMPTE